MRKEKWALFALLAMTANANAASIVVLSLGQNKLSQVVITGDLDIADKDDFLQKIAPLSSAIVSFSSDGGNLLAGLKIGEMIRQKNFSTLVPEQARCASSCALAWLGGTRRFMGAGAQVGFHAAYDGQTREVTSSGNALVGAYLNEIGLPYSAVVYITSASPDSMTWLSEPDAERLGIEVSRFKDTGRANAPTPGALAAPSPQAAAAAPVLSDQSDSARMETVRAFYSALTSGDGNRAASLVIPEKRANGPLSASVITRYYSSLSKPLELVGLVSLGDNRYQADFSYGAGTRACHGSAVVTLVQRDGSTFVRGIRAQKDLCS